MNRLVSTALLGLAAASAAPALASTPAVVESALEKYCEPLIAGSKAEQLSDAAISAGFKADQVAGVAVLINGELILSLSDDPRVCFLQAPMSMTFAQGVSFVGAWAARHPSARQGAATAGPDGRPVRLWAVPEQKKYLLVTEQINGRGQKVLNFILAPLPAN